ncbi:EamA family transporter [Candidatus Microgenomates bacterium]|nr:EamA family transporter [Candidatus Microgenomates bacterium]
MWFFLSLLSALLYAWRSIIEKHIIKGKNKYILGFDKIGINNSNAYVYGFVNYLFVSISLFIIALIKARHAMKELWMYKKVFFIIGLIVASYTITYMVALEDGFTFYVMAIRSSSIIFTIILSYIFFKEKRIKSKLVAGFFIILGLLCIKLLG